MEADMVFMACIGCMSVAWLAANAIRINRADKEEARKREQL